MQFKDKFPLIVIYLFCLSVHVNAQELKKMTPEIYNQWNKIKNVKTSDSAEVIMYTLEKETGDKTLCLYDRASENTRTYPRVGKSALDITGQYLMYTHSLSYDSMRVLKRKKTPKDKLPADSLSIICLHNNKMVTFADVTDFTAPSKSSGYCIFTKKITPVSKDTTHQSSKKTKDKCTETALFIHHLVSGQTDTILRVKDYILAEDSTVLAYAQCFGDSIIYDKVHMTDLTTKSTQMVKDSTFHLTQLSIDKKGGKLAFLALDKKTDSIRKPYELYLKTEQDSNCSSITRGMTTFLTENGLLSADRKITWSESGKRLFFGFAPVIATKDTTLLDDEFVNVEIWHHDSPRLYTQMEATLDTDRKQSYAVMYDIPKKEFLQLETPDADKSLTSLKGDGRYVLQIRNKPYQKEVTWLGESRKDLTLLDTETTQATLLVSGEFGNPQFSPAGKYIYWWSRQDSIYKIFNIEKSSVGILGLWSFTKFHNEENDVPQLADAYGIAGWLKSDEGVIVYDRYDMWKLHPQDPFAHQVLTDGRASKAVHRYIDTDPDKDYIESEKDLLLHAFSEVDKNEQYLTFNLNSGVLKKLTGGDYSLTKNVIKAKKKDIYIFTKENFSIFPDLHISNADFTQIKKISDANPQQKLYGWGSNRLFQWTNHRGQPNTGMLFFPPDFDPSKKYPLIVNFYERSSDDLHRHRAPEAHRSSINYTYYTNIGYVVFNPDISYLTGQPGEDCYNAVESGVDALLKLGYIDENKMALQGHSWGGYQVAYLLTRTGRYKCAEAGAPVVNMVSAYGGIRWESGMSRMFQYEKQQSRLGFTLWENKDLYHKNSPIYDMTKVTTPVLIMHNDEDGAVPWYQGIEYFMALRRLNKPAWMLNYNGEPHWPVKWQNRLDFNIRMEQFFNHYLMDGPLPLWMKEGNTPLEKGILNKY
ncbi:MAG: S9 family peptidase [Saprospiraceae bacterium]|nr:S9 family peptidase [Saprospiraceae bacterium]